MTGLWSQANRLAIQTPSSRNRAADFFRASSIIVVIVGHWLMAAPYIDASGVSMDHILAKASWTHWLTWGLQVMPIFFFVGGFSNGITWDAANRDGRGYGPWLGARLKRLLYPVVILMVFWTVLAIIAHRVGISSEAIKVGSQIALVPTWFLAIYSVIVILAPLARMAWKKWGLSTLVTLLCLSVCGDLLYFHLELKALGWANYLFVWLAVHQLGFAWLDRRYTSTNAILTWIIFGSLLLITMTQIGPWPISLVGVPGAEVSNTTPPHLPLLALAAVQFGVVLSLENRINRALKNMRRWTLIIMLNGMIMTIFLWHSTVMILAFGVAFSVGGIGLHSVPLGGDWWMSRLVWIGIFCVALIPFVAAFLRFETSPSARSESPSSWRSVIGTGLMAGGLAILAYGGIGDSNIAGINVVALSLFFVGAYTASIIKFPTRLDA
jgi:hypothetical protein